MNGSRAPTDWTVELVFRHGPAFFTEPRRYEGPLESCLADTKRDGRAGAFGREHVGFASFHPSPAELSLEDVPASRGPLTDDPTVPLAELLGAFAVDLDTPASPESPRLAIDQRALESIHWWAHDGAFGPATEAGVALGRCASTDASEALEAAHVVGHEIAHQQSLYPVTAVAVPFVLQLLETEGLLCRSELAGWFQVVIDSAEESRGTTAELLASVRALLTPSVAKAHVRQVQAAKEVRRVLDDHRSRIEGLRLRREDY